MKYLASGAPGHTPDRRILPNGKTGAVWQAPLATPHRLSPHTGAAVAQDYSQERAPPHQGAYSHAAHHQCAALL